MNFRRLVSLCILFLLPACLAVLHAQLSQVDDIQRTITLRTPAQRIVSLAPSITESLFAIGAGEKVVGVTDFCNYPADARRKPRIGGITNPSIESIVSLKPDLVVLSMEGNIRDDFRRLTSMGITVFVTNPRNLEGIYRSLTQLGALTGTADSATRLITGLRKREAAVRARAPRTPVRTLLIISIQPLIVAGRNTFIHELLDVAGGSNLAAYARGAYPTYSRETVIANNPDVILVTSDALGDASALMRIFPEWREVAAVRHKRVFRVESDILTRPGPRALDALESLVYLVQATP